jgi:hypothetical protein
VVLESILVKLGSSGGGGGVNKMELLGIDGVQRQESVFKLFETWGCKTVNFHSLTSGP